MLAATIDLNRDLAVVSSPLFASTVGHAIGAITALLLIVVQRTVAASNRASAPIPKGPPPLWSYLGGIPGGFALIFAILVANTSLGLSTTIALMLAGQITCGMAIDQLGLFGLPKRKLRPADFVAISMISFGSVMIIYLER